MEQTSIKGQAFRVLTDAVNGIFHRVSLWTHADDVEMENGDTLTVAMNDKYNLNNSNVQVLTSINELDDNTFGCFTVDELTGYIQIDSVRFYHLRKYMYFSYSYMTEGVRFVIVMDTGDLSSSGELNGTPLYALRWRNGFGWDAHIMSSEQEMFRLQQILEQQIEDLNQTKLGYDRMRLEITHSLDAVPMNTSGTLYIAEATTHYPTTNTLEHHVIGYHDTVSNITTSIKPGEYTFFSVESNRGHKTIILFSNTQLEGSSLILGGGYVCTNIGTSASKWIITRILSPTDFSTDETGLREQVVASLTGQLWPVGSLYLNLTRQNPGEFLGGTWNLITEGILTAINGSPEQAGYHQRDLYKAVKDEDRGEHLYGVFMWQRIA